MDAAHEAPGKGSIDALMPSGKLDLIPEEPIAVAVAAATSAGVSMFGLTVGALSTVGNSMIDLMKKRRSPTPCSYGRDRRSGGLFCCARCTGSSTRVATKRTC